MPGLGSLYVAERSTDGVEAAATAAITRLRLRAHRLPGVLVTADGNDGTGKTTTLDVLEEELRARGCRVERVRMPSSACREHPCFRRYAEDPTRAERGETDLAALCLLCLADRLIAVRESVIPALETGAWVLCDRYLYTALAELLALGCSGADLEAVLAVAGRFPLPDIGLVTTVSPDESIRRVRTRPLERDRAIDPLAVGRIGDAFLTIARAQGLTVLATDGGRRRLLAHVEPLVECQLAERSMTPRAGSAPRAKRAVLFDLFGTLVPGFSFARFEAVIAELAAIVGTPATEFRRLWVGSFRERLVGRFESSAENLRWACRELGVEPGEEQLARAVGLLLAFARRSLVAAPEHLKLLDTLRSRGLLVGLLSNCSPDVPAMWSSTELAPRFDFTGFSCVFGSAKPAPRLYLEACRRLGVTPGECLYVGDGSDRELTAAANLGMSAVLLEVPTDDAYDVARHDVRAWRGAAVSSLDEVLELALVPPASPP